MPEDEDAVDVLGLISPASGDIVYALFALGGVDVPLAPVEGVLGGGGPILGVGDLSRVLDCLGPLVADRLSLLLDSLGLLNCKVNSLSHQLTSHLNGELDLMELSKHELWRMMLLRCLLHL